jgi:hypothetical protein
MVLQMGLNLTIAVLESELRGRNLLHLMHEPLAHGLQSGQAMHLAAGAVSASSAAAASSVAAAAVAASGLESDSKVKDEYAKPPKLTCTHPGCGLAFSCKGECLPRLVLLFCCWRICFHTRVCMYVCMYVLICMY